MATMNPVLRLRQAFRSMGAEEEQADEAVDAIQELSYDRDLLDARFEALLARQDQKFEAMRREMAELRKEMAELRNQILLGMVLIAGVTVTILTVVIAVFD